MTSTVKMYLPLLLVVGLAYAVNARDCLSPKAMESLDMSKFQGVWYDMAYGSANKTDQSEYDGTLCPAVTYKLEGDHINVKATYTYEGKVNEEVGKYTPADNKKAMFHLNFPDIPSNNDFVLNVMCTDYNNYAVIYSAAQYESGHCSEFEVVMLRDRSKYGEIAKSDNIKNCLHDKLQSSLDHLKPIHQNDCH